MLNYQRVALLSDIVGWYVGMATSLWCFFNGPSDNPIWHPGCLSIFKHVISKFKPFSKLFPSLFIGDIPHRMSMTQPSGCFAQPVVLSRRACLSPLSAPLIAWQWSCSWTIARRRRVWSWFSVASSQAPVGSCWLGMVRLYPLEWRGA